jgi:nucleoside 2-deoxyribosyltransferase
MTTENQQNEQPTADPGKAKVYLASGWFSPAAAEELTQLENIFDKREWIDLASPRRIFVCPPDADKEVQDKTFVGNLQHITAADFLLVNTRDKDIGTIWEAGFGFAHQKPIIYFCAGLPEGAKFNLMLARSGVKVCSSFEELEDYLDRCFEAQALIPEPYSQAIE